MNRLPILALAMLLPSGAYAINDTTVNAVGNDNSALGIGGSVNGSIVNNNSGNSTTTAGAINNASSATANNSLTNTNTSSSNSTNRNSNRQRQQQGQGQGQTQNSTSSVDSSGNSSNSYVAEAQKRNPVNTAWAPPLVAAYECFGSRSGGMSLYGISVSGGSTEPSEVCELVYLSRELERKGKADASLAMLCFEPRIRKAMAADHENEGRTSTLTRAA